jgi:hypothetical protein
MVKKSLLSFNFVVECKFKVYSLALKVKEGMGTPKWDYDKFLSQAHDHIKLHKSKREVD